MKTFNHDIGEYAFLGLLVATVVTTAGEASIGFTIGWHDRQHAIPFWTGDGVG